MSEKKRFRKKFKRVFKEIDYLRDKIYKKERVFLFIKKHKYSQEELLNSFHQEKIISITEKIGDDAKNWYIRGNLSIKEKKIYEECRENVEDELHNIHREIEEREPTWWESFQGVFKKFVILVMNNLPVLKNFLLFLGKSLGKLPGPLGEIGILLTKGIDLVLKSIPKDKILEIKR